MNKNKRTYMICSVASEEKYNPCALLCDVTFLDGPKFLVPVIHNTEEFPWHSHIDNRYTELKYFKINKILAKADSLNISDELSDEDTKKLTEQEWDKAISRKAYQKPTPKYKIKVSLKLDVDELALENKIFCMGASGSSLIFKEFESEEKNTIRRFKKMVEGLYFGVLNQSCCINSRIHHFYLDGLVTGINPNFKKEDLNIDKITDSLNFLEMDKLYLRIFDDQWGLSTLSTDFQSKLEFLIQYIMNSDLDTLNKIDQILKDTIPEYGGFYTNRVEIPIELFGAPVPIFNIDRLITKKDYPDESISLVTDSWEEFLFDGKYFAMDISNGNKKELKQIMRFLSDDIIVKTLNEEKTRTLKEYLNGEK